MKKRMVCTFIGANEFKKVYAGAERNFIELSWIEHYGVNYEKMKSFKCVTTIESLRKKLDYRGIPALEQNQRYIVWLSDYKGNKKLRFSGVQKYE